MEYRIIQIQKIIHQKELEGQVEVISSIDKNKNNIPDEVEKYLDLNKRNVNGNVSNNTTKSNDDIFKKAIDEGYICIFFETGKSVYKSSSNDSVNFILTYLLTNPEAKMDLIGYTDEIGPNEYNKKLGLDRANYVKETLVKNQEQNLTD